MAARKREPIADPVPPAEDRPVADLQGVTNLSEVVARHAAVSPADAALIETGPDGERGRVGYAELERRIQRAAAVLGRHGLIAGDRVGLLGVNSIDWVVAYLGCLRAGGVALPLNPQLTSSERRRLIDHAQPRLMLADASAGPGVTGDDLPGPQWLPIGLAEDAEVVVETPRDAENLAVLITTAGSTGTPKSVMLSQRALIAHCAQTAQISPATSESVVLAMLPFFHIYALNAILGQGLYLGACLVLVDGYPDNLADIIAEQHVSELPVTPSVLYRLLPTEGLVDKLASVDQVISGGAPLPNALRESFRRATGLSVDQGYGMTEAAPGICSTRVARELPAPAAAPTPSSPPAGPGADLIGGFVGPPIPGVQVRVGDGSQPSEAAELHIRGANLFSGYWPDGHGGPDDDGWFATGDVGFATAEGVHLVDRVAELIIVSGFNVYPAEIEEVLREFDQVADAAVIGQPDEHTGERVVAFVTGHRQRPNPAGLRTHCRARLARYKLPVEIYVLPKLPKTSTGKVRKNKLRDLLDTSDSR